ncbi:MAG: DUF3299 domain-containing protein [Planctomycetota bacterium]
MLDLRKYIPLVLSLSLFAVACSDEPAPVDPPAEAEVEVVEEPATIEEQGTEPANDTPSPEEVTDENTDDLVAEQVEESLMGRINVTEPDPEDLPTWSQATTVEERQANLEKALAKESPYYIDLHDLGGWILDERDEKPIPDYILALDGKEFVMRGFMMPDIDFEHIRKFHLVRSLYSCCFGAPPQLNEILRVTLQDTDGMDYTYNTLEVRGTLHIEFEMIDGLVEDIFRLENATYRVLDFDDPEAPETFDATTGFDGVVPSEGLEY